MSIYDLNAYEVIREEDLSDLKSKGILLKHKKSWLEKFSGERPVCGTGKGITEYVFECYDLSGQDIISGCKL